MRWWHVEREDEGDEGRDEGEAQSCGHNRDRCSIRAPRCRRDGHGTGLGSVFSPPSFFSFFFKGCKCLKIEHFAMAKKINNKKSNKN